MRFGNPSYIYILLFWLLPALILFYIYAFRRKQQLIELFCESDRIDYLRGLKIDIPKGERGEGTDPYTSEDFVWDIPVREQLYNENLK